jgi:hypothetical protein
MMIAKVVDRSLSPDCYKYIFVCVIFREKVENVTLDIVFLLWTENKFLKEGVNQSKIDTFRSKSGLYQFQELSIVVRFWLKNSCEVCPNDSE